MGMFPLSALVAHAELKSRAKQAASAAAEARGAIRITRYGNLTLFPRVERGEPAEVTPFEVGEAMPDEIIDAVWEEPRVIASISNVSATGVGLILSDELPAGLQFDCHWDAGAAPVPVRFEVVHTQPMQAGLYRTGARLVAGELPAEPVPTPFVRRFALASEAVPEPAVAAVLPEPTPMRLAPADTVDAPLPAGAAPMMMTLVRDGIMQIERRPTDEKPPVGPVPPGTFRAASAAGFEKVERLDGVTTCNWERSIEMKRDGSRMWVYIHSPGKKNGWGIYVDADQFESAVNRLQIAGGSPFLTTTLAA